METWELIARERVRDTLATYNWSGDAGKAADLAAAFTPDGVLEIRGGDAHHGRDAIARFIGGVATGDRPRRPAPERRASGERRIVRHALTNTRFVELTRDSATVASYFTVFTEIGLDHYGRYRDRFVPLGDEWLIAHRFVSTDWHSTASTMAGR
jgi:hypothetical protein